MTKLLKIATLSLALGIPALAHGASETAAASTSTAIVELARACPLSDEVLSGIATLQKHGDRFQPVIELIKKEATKPGWTWGPECDAAAVVARDAEK